MELINHQGPNSKIQEVIPIPLDLLVFLKEVHLLILDEADVAVWQSDDLLQCECAFGGLVRQHDTQYGFTYYPALNEEQNAEEPTTWELLLDKSEIERIAVGRQKQLTLWACQVNMCGSKFTSATGLCNSHDYDNIAV